MRFETIAMTPAMAERFLARNEGNRLIRRYKVEAIADAIRRGEWETTHQGIAIDPDGRLIDGQHRLSAIIAAGATVPVVVCYDVPPSAVPVIDTGTRRSSADVGRTVGLSRDSMTAGRLCVAWESGRGVVWGGANVYGKATNSQIIAWLQRWPGDMANDVSRIGAATAKGLGRHGARSVLTAHWMLTAWHTPHTHERYIDDFVGRLADGANLSIGDPRLTYRNFVRAAPRLSAQENLAKLTMAWNAYTQGRHLKQLKWTKPPMPPLVGR